MPVWGKGPVPAFFCCFSFFFCVPKRRNKKKAPQPVLALRASLTSRRGRDAKKLGLRPQTVGVSATVWLRLPLASFAAPACEARQDKWGKGKSHRYAAEHRKNCRKGRLHCLSAASLQHPGSFEERRVSRLRRDKCPGGLFFGSFLWASKEMNILCGAVDEQARGTHG
jgi:hypothetical protein